MYVEWIDENRWRWIDDEDEITDQVYSNIYRKGEDSFTVYKDFLRFNVDGRITEMTLSEIAEDIARYDEYVRRQLESKITYVSIYADEEIEIARPIQVFKNDLRILSRRGIFNGVSHNKSLYEYCGWNWEI